MGRVVRRKGVTTDVSLTGWEALYESSPACGTWMGIQLQWNINCLELKAVFMRNYHVLI